MQYDLSLTVVGDELDPDEVTRVLGIAPTQSNRRGDRVETREFARIMPTGVWRLKEPEQHQSTALSERIIRFLAPLRPTADEWEAIAARFRVTLSLGCFESGTNAAISFSPQVCRRLAELGIELSQDIYMGLRSEKSDSGDEPSNTTS